MGVENVTSPSPPLGFDPWNVQSIASRFTNYTILAKKENFAVTNGIESFIGRYLFVSFISEYFYCIENFEKGVLLFLFICQMFAKCEIVIVFGCD
jgi:hypothetical protein